MFKPVGVLSFVGLASALLLAVAGSASGSRPGGSRSPGRPVVYGYPYGRQCPGAGIAERVDRWGMYECNCTSFVAWALSANHQRIDWFIRGSMDAWNWPHVARLSSLKVDRTPAPGAVAVWPSLARPFGHVAYVTGVEHGGTIDVAEYNYPSPSGGQTFGFETRTFASSNGAVFIHVPGVGRRPSSLPTSLLR